MNPRNIGSSPLSKQVEQMPVGSYNDQFPKSTNKQRQFAANIVLRELCNLLMGAVYAIWFVESGRCWDIFVLGPYDTRHESVNDL